MDPHQRIPTGFHTGFSAGGGKDVAYGVVPPREVWVHTPKEALKFRYSQAVFSY